MTVSAVIPTLNGAATLPALLGALAREIAARRGLTEIVAIDSGSRDGTLELLGRSGARVLDLGGGPFGHGSARNRAAAAASGEVLLFLTQDVEPCGDGWLPPLLAAFDDQAVAGAFGRQVPRGAAPEDEFLARVNYGGRPRRLTRADLGAAFGPGRTYFSNAFGAVRTYDTAPEKVAGIGGDGLNRFLVSIQRICVITYIFTPETLLKSFPQIGSLFS